MTLKKILALLTAFVVYLNASAQLNAEFTSNTTQGCSPLIVFFRDQSTGGPTEWRWDLGNGSISTERNPSAIYFTPGTYTVKLYIKGASGIDSIVKSDYITVFQEPVVDFGASPTEGCPPLGVQFADLSVGRSGNINKWIWDFGDGVTSSEQNPSHTYTLTDTFNVSLTVTNDYGCKKSLQKSSYIKISPSPTAGFKYTYSNACQAPATVSFLNTSTSSTPVSYQWFFGDGQTSSQINPSHVYLTAGVYEVTLTATGINGCSSTYKEIISIGTSKADFSYTNFCLNHPVTFTDISSPEPLRRLWNFGDGTTDSGEIVTHNYQSGGPFTVSLIANFGGCSDTAVKVIQAGVKPVINFSYTGKNVTCTYPTSIQFINSTQGATGYQWLFGDGTSSTDPNPQHVYTAQGKYTVTLIAFGVNGCADTLVKDELVKIGPPQIKNLGNTPFRGCAPQAVLFSPLIDFGENVNAYKWDFGDGSTSAEAEPTHLYQNEGVYDVTLIVTTNEGCSDTLRVSGAVALGLAPTALFSAEPLDVCADVPIQFTDSSTGNITSWRWFFGDGSAPSEERNPLHVYIDTGYMDVKLVVGQFDCYDTLEIERYVHIKPPIAKFSLNSACSDPYKYTFKDRSIGAKRWSWNFGDSVTATGRNQVHTYGSTGAYLVSLTVANGACTYTAYDTLKIIDEKPTYTFDYLTSGHCKYDSIRFTATGYNPANIAGFQWDFGDGTKSDFNISNNIVYHRYANAGTYTPRLIATDIKGCFDTINNNLTVQVYGPKAAFSNKEGVCVFATVDFTDESVSDGTHPIKTWIWNYGDGSAPDTLTAPPFSHTYNVNGAFNVTLKVIDANSCYDTVTNRSLYIAKPVAGFSSQDTLSCKGSPVNFTSSSTGISLNYFWDFGDGQNGTDANPAHSYSADGVYDVKLFLTDKYGCRDSTFRPAYIRVASPVASFILNDTLFSCPPGKINPVNTSINYTSFIWDFGDGNISAEPAPEHYYTQGGVYTLKLSISGYGNCYDTFTKPIILKGPSANLIYSPDVGCNPLSVAFSADAKNTVKYIWDFGNGVVTTSTIGTGNYTYASPGKFLPKLVVVDSGGCQVPIVNADTIVVSEASAQFSVTRQPGFCDSSLYEFTDASTLTYDTTIAYFWQFGDGVTSTEARPLHFYRKLGLYTASLQITTKHGCQSSYTSKVDVLIDTTPHVLAIIPASACANTVIPLSAGVRNDSPGNYTWLWDFGNGDHSTGYDTSYAYPTAGTYNISVSATSSAGCTGTAAQVIVVNPSPQTDAGPDAVICKGSSITLTATGADTYDWVNNPSLSCTNCPDPVASPPFNATYFVTGTNSYGCSTNDSVYVEVKQPANVSVDAPDTICIGTTITLKASGAELYEWQPASAVSSSTDSTVTSTPSSSTTYTVIGTDTKGCFYDTASVFVSVFPIPVIQLTDSAIQIAVGDEYQINATGSPDITLWNWQPPSYISCTNCPNPIVKPRNTQTYTVTAYNAAECNSRESITITVVCNKDQNIFIPNTFSPNGDGMNDYFYPRGKGLTNIRSFRIFNRWGSIVYQRMNFPSNQQSYGWDGTYNGKALQPDVYVYVVEILCENGQVISSKGNVSLLR